MFILFDENMNSLFLKKGIFETHCGILATYGRKHVRGIANICNAGITSDKMDAMSAQACSS